MKLTKTSEYAIRIMVYLANRQGEQLSALLLHQKLNIPYKYLGKMMRNLAAAGLVKSRRGKTGGYRLCCDLDKITLAHIVDVVEGLDSYERCLLGFETCGDEKPCPMHKLWGPQRDAIKAMIYNTTLQDLVDQEGISF
jgi:Rrf2 family transcriptional regulator, iron-sulfur cluster assembly transcription factor